jgi:hypothetical protein
MHFKEAEQKYNHNIKWVFLMEDEEIKKFFNDYVWDVIQSGKMHDIIKWTPGALNGFENAIIKSGGSKNEKNVLLYRDTKYEPKFNAAKFSTNTPKHVEDTLDNLGNKKYNKGGGAISDYTRNLVDSGMFDSAVIEFDGKYTYGKASDKDSKFKAPLVKYAGFPVPGTEVVKTYLAKIINMFGYPRQPADDRELSLFELGSEQNSGNVEQEDEVAKAYELLSKSGKYKISAKESVIRESYSSDEIEALKYLSSMKSLLRNYSDDPIEFIKIAIDTDGKKEFLIKTLGSKNMKNFFEYVKNGGIIPGTWKGLDDVLNKLWQVKESKLIHALRIVESAGLNVKEIS